LASFGEENIAVPDLEADWQEVDFPPVADDLTGELDLPAGESVIVEEEEDVAVAVVGCPNAGKSSLINALLGENRLVASEVAGTTRDSIDLPFTDAGGRQFTLIDTAGIRRKSRIAMRIEKFSVMAALKAIDRAEIAVLVLDAQREEISDQDRRVATLATGAGCGLVIVVNKWDTVSGGRKAQKDYLRRVEDAFPLFPHAPVLFISAKRGRGIKNLLDTVHRIWRLARQRISTGRLNRWLADAIEKHPPPRRAGRAIKIRYMTQIAIEPPTLLIFANRPDQVHETYRRYLEKQFRESFDFSGVPVRLLFRKGENPFEKSGRG
jgi:GTPase